MRASSMMALAAFTIALFGCGSGDDNATTDSGPGDTTTKMDAGKDSTTGADVGKDTTPVDTSTDTAPPADTSTDAPVTDSGACSMVTAKDCTTCCNKAYKKGYRELVAAELECACGMDIDGGKAPTLCGPYDAGVKDSGALGVGACTAMECGGDAGVPDKDCLMCLRAATGTATKQGECYSSVAATCTDAGTDCVDYVACLEGCK